MKGIWLPIITPFKNDSIDMASYKNMIDYYIGQGITGIIPMGTTGESFFLLIFNKCYRALDEKGSDRFSAQWNVVKIMLIKY